MRDGEGGTWKHNYNARRHLDEKAEPCGNYGFDKPMINFIDGKINVGGKNVFTFSDYDELNALAERNVIEKRKGPSNGEPYFYVEDVVGSMRFGIVMSLREKRIEWFLLRWLDGPCTSKGWDDVSEKALKDEYRSLLNFVERRPSARLIIKGPGVVRGVLNGGKLT